MKRGERIPVAMAAIEGKCICTQSLYIGFVTDKFEELFSQPSGKQIYIEGTSEFVED